MNDVNELEEPTPSLQNNLPTAEQPPQSPPGTPQPSTTPQNPEKPNTTPLSTKTPLVIKFLLILILIITVIYTTLFILSKFTNKGINEAGACFQREVEIGDQEYENIKNISDLRERTRYFCRTDTESLNRLISCLEQVKSKYSLSVSILKAFPKYTKTLTDTVDSHNSACADSPIILPE